MDAVWFLLLLVVVVMGFFCFRTMRRCAGICRCFTGKWSNDDLPKRGGVLPSGPAGSLAPNSDRGTIVAAFVALRALARDPGGRTWQERRNT